MVITVNVQYLLASCPLSTVEMKTASLSELVFKLSTSSDDTITKRPYLCECSHGVKKFTISMKGKKKVKGTLLGNI